MAIGTPYLFCTFYCIKYNTLKSISCLSYLLEQDIAFGVLGSAANIVRGQIDKDRDLHV
jgi:hypothetical protein